MEVSRLLSSSDGRPARSAAEPVPPPRFTIDVYSDTICPWGYLGKKHLDRAIALYRSRNPDAEFRLSWNPFILRPNAKVADWSKRGIFHSKFGPGAPAFFERVEQVGAPYGIEWYWEGTTGNSRDSHKLILMAMDQDAAAAAAALSGQAHSPPPSRPSSPLASSMASPSLRYPDTRQDATVLALYRGMFEQGQDMSDRVYLAELALRLGLADDAEAVRAWLDSDEANARVDAAVARAKAAGIEGVPSFVVQGRYRVGGMQEPVVFLELFDKIRERELGADNVEFQEIAKGTMASGTGRPS